MSNREILCYNVLFFPKKIGYDSMSGFIYLFIFGNMQSIKTCKLSNTITDTGPIGNAFTGSDWGLIFTHLQWKVELEMETTAPV